MKLKDMVIGVMSVGFDIAAALIQAFAWAPIAMYIRKSRFLTKAISFDSCDQIVKLFWN